MLEWHEADPLPPECVDCKEDDCWECDYAGARWVLNPIDELRVRKKGLLKAIERYQKQIAIIDTEIARLEQK